MFSIFFYKLIFKVFNIKVHSVISNSFYDTLYLLPTNSISTLLLFLKKNTSLRQTMLTELTIYDEPLKKNRFTLVCFLLSVEYNNRICLKTSVASNLFFDSINHIYPNSNWSEREIRDMFGIFFIGNSDLRRLLTDYSFGSFPLRKDFPLTGYTEVRYDDELQRILYEPVELAQEFRVFSIKSPWE